MVWRNAVALELGRIQYDVGRIDLLSVLQIPVRKDASACGSPA